MRNPNPRTRAWLYGVALAVLPLAILYVAGGFEALFAPESEPLWATLLGAILVPGLALANVGDRGIRQDRR